MRYTVTWLPRAQQELARLWMQASDKRAMTTASHRIDQLLRSAPLLVGTAHGGHFRLRVPPLEVAYSVSAADLVVEVTYVALLP